MDVHDLLRHYKWRGRPYWARVVHYGNPECWIVWQELICRVTGIRVWKSRGPEYGYLPAPGVVEHFVCKYCSACGEWVGYGS